MTEVTEEDTIEVVVMTVLILVSVVVASVRIRTSIID